MNETTTVKAQDGHTLEVYVAQPEGTPKAAVIVVQEIFGVNAYIRSVADRLAGEGYLAVAPALFDRYERGFDVGYDADDVERGLAIMVRTDMHKAMLDVLAAVEFARDEYKTKVGVVGFCFGGTLAWLAAANLPVSAAVGYYGGYIAKNKDLALAAPVMLHFGAEDGHIPQADVDQVRAAHPEVPVHVYAGAGHGFACDRRESYNAGASDEAWGRTLAFLKENLDGALEDRGTTA